MEKTVKSSLTDDKLTKNETEAIVTTDGDFFKWVDDIIAEAFNESSDEE